MKLYIYIYIEKNPRRARVRAETRTCGTDSPSRSKSRALSITPLHHPQKKDGSMTDFQHTQSDPHRSHRKMLHVLLTHLPPRCALTFFFPAPEGQAVKRLRTPPSKVLKEQRYFFFRKEGSQNKSSDLFRVISSDDSCVDRIACARSPSLSHLFFEDGAMA